MSEARRGKCAASALGEAASAAVGFDPSAVTPNDTCCLGTGFST